MKTKCIYKPLGKILLEIFGVLLSLGAFCANSNAQIVISGSHLVAENVTETYTITGIPATYSASGFSLPPGATVISSSSIIGGTQTIQIQLGVSSGTLIAVYSNGNNVEQGSFAITIYGESIYYVYDGNGNRTSSSLTLFSHAPLRHHQNDSAGNDSNKVLPTIKVYPNPTAGQINVSISSLQSCEFATIYLSDASGNLLSTQKATSTVIPISLASYNQGAFYVKIIMCDNQYSFKVIKNNPGGRNTSTSSQPHPSLVK